MNETGDFSHAFLSRETRAELPFIGDQVVCLSQNQGYPLIQRADVVWAGCVMDSMTYVPIFWPISRPAIVEKR